MRITESEQEKRRNTMIHTAYDLFYEYGIDGVSMSQLAQASNLSRNSIFRYFKTKAELVQCTQIILWQEMISCILTNNQSQLKNSKNGLEQVKHLLFSFKDLYKNHSKYLLFAVDYKLFLVRNNIVLSENQSHTLMVPIVEAFCSALEKGHNDGSINNLDSTEAQFFLAWSLLRSFVTEIVIYDKTHSGINPWERQFEFILCKILNMLEA
ncbi:MAG: helix-turn-helix domain-containing protein [Hydrogenoanaerobacterium sp.]